MNNKKTTVITISATLALILLVATATYAYFEADLGNNKEVDVSVSTLTENDRFSFAVGDPLALQADETSFVKGGDSVSDTTTATALLTANNKTNNATKYYYLYLLISQNEFIYSQDENTPELILTITKPDGTKLTTLDGLTYKTVSDGKGTTIKGFDVTTKKGLITIADNRKITTTSTIEEKWSITLTLVNYDVNQIDNLGKMFSSRLMIQQDEFVPSPANICSSNQSLNSCIISLSGYVDTLYYHDSTLTNGAGDNSYRYAGASDSVNNYICLGSDEVTCPEKNTFRIIGLFNSLLGRKQIKVIKSSSNGSNAWNTASTASNKWSSSSLYTYLNETYLTSLGTLTDKIAQGAWSVKGVVSEKMYSAIPSIVYSYDAGLNDWNSLVGAKIGLMYVSDYGFAASPVAWSTAVYQYSNKLTDGTTIKSQNWLYLGSDEWKIFPSTNGIDGVYSVTSVGSVTVASIRNSKSIRPVFYLDSNITYASGTGTSSDPIRITD